MNSKLTMIDRQKDAVPFINNVLERKLFSQTVTKYRGLRRRRGPVKLAWRLVESVLGYFFAHNTN
jgi:hypothetical protein